jgi:hypothetical protein
VKDSEVVIQWLALGCGMDLAQGVYYEIPKKWKETVGEDQRAHVL